MQTERRRTLIDLRHRLRWEYIPSLSGQSAILGRSGSRPQKIEASAHPGAAMTGTVIINGKFFGAALEGMPRVGREITAAMDKLLAEPAWSHMDLRLCVPRGTSVSPELRNIPLDQAGRRRGFLWEQIDLPRHAAGRLVLNFTSTGPVLSRRALTVVHDAQQYSTPRSFHWKNRLLYRTVTPAVCRRHARILTVSEFARQQILQHRLCGAEKIVVVHNAADHMLRIPAARGILDRLRNPTAGFLLCNSYTHAHKNVRVIFEALGSRPDLAGRLVLFGSCTRRHYEAKGIAVPEGVQFLGRVTDEELRCLFSCAAMFLFPSKTEGFGLPALEAMILGCPTIAASAGALPEVCGDGALYADPSRPAEWLAAITTLLGDGPRRQALGQAGRCRAASFSWMRSAERYLELISSTAS